MPRYTEEDVVRWYARYQQGLTLKEVAQEFGVSTPTVLGEFVRRGWERRPPVRRSAPVRPRPERPPVLPVAPPPGVPEREWRVLLERRAGRTLAEIGRDLGVSRQRVAQIEARALNLLAERQSNEPPGPTRVDEAG